MHTCIYTCAHVHCHNPWTTYTTTCSSALQVLFPRNHHLTQYIGRENQPTNPPTTQHIGILFPVFFSPFAGDAARGLPNRTKHSSLWVRGAVLHYRYRSVVGLAWRGRLWRGRSSNHSISRSADQPNRHSADQPISQTTNQPISQSVGLAVVGLAAVAERSAPGR